MDPTNDILIKFAAEKCGVKIVPITTRQHCVSPSSLDTTPSANLTYMEATEYYIINEGSAVFDYSQLFDPLTSWEWMGKDMDRAFVAHVDWHIQPFAISMTKYFIYCSSRKTTKIIAKHREPIQNNVISNFESVVPYKFWLCWFRVEQQGEEKP